MLKTLGPGVLTQDNLAWQQARQRLQGQFTSHNITHCVNQSTPIVLDVVDQWAQAPMNLSLNLSHLATCVMMQLLAATMLQRLFQK